ncbi:MFS transporter [Microlunatus endophyticus]|uniref:MFS transporter n=1 Tax=Microlunatus endophyticus TaxID=1716077 RepID=UPI0016650EE2|nr:MFS transporter [Microlunatus endophyticus]
MWRNRDFTILWSGRAVSELGSSISFVALPLLALTVGSARDAGFVLATSTIASSGVALFAGAVTDRINRRLGLLISTLIRAIAYASLVVAGLAGLLTLAQLYAVAAVAGLTSPFFTTAETAALRTVVRADQLPTAYSQNQVRSTVAELIGMPIGGVLYGIARSLPFGVNAVSFLVELLAIGAIRAPLPAPGRRKSRSIRRDIGSGLAFIWRHPFLRPAIIAIGIINFVSMWPVLLLTLHDHHVSPTMIGITSSILTVSTLVGALIAPGVTHRVPAGMVIIVCTWILVAAIAIMAIASSVFVIIGALLVGLAAVPAVAILLSSYETAVTPDAMVGRVSAASGFISTIAIPGGQAVGSAVYVAAGSHVAFGLYTLAAIIGAIVLTASAAVRKLRTITADEDQLTGA